VPHFEPPHRVPLLNVMGLRRDRHKAFFAMYAIHRKAISMVLTN